VSAAQLTRAEILALPPAIPLATLAQALGVSEPVIRAAYRAGELELLGIRVNKLGAQYRVVTASLHAYLGLDGGASTVPAGGNGAGQDRPATPAMRPGGQDAPSGDAIAVMLATTIRKLGSIDAGIEATVRQLVSGGMDPAEADAAVSEAIGVLAVLIERIQDGEEDGTP
jgi:hypothetical protein